MSRTYRNQFQHFLRQPKTESHRRNLVRIIDELSEFGFNADNRTRSLVSSIPSAWDDLVVSAQSEKF